jgi:hypothetical protein
MPRSILAAHYPLTSAVWLLILPMSLLDLFRAFPANVLSGTLSTPAIQSVGWGPLIARKCSASSGKAMADAFNEQRKPENKAKQPSNWVAESPLLRKLLSVDK